MESVCGPEWFGNGISAPSSRRSGPEAALPIGPAAPRGRSDVLIIGAGSAGSVLAERLSADAGCDVTVVEAGPAPSDPKVSAQITDAVRMPIGAASSVVRHFATTLTDQPVRVGHIMRGAVVGGSGAVNGGYFCRASPDGLRELVDSRLVMGRRTCHTFARSRAILTSSARCTARTDRSSSVACLNSTDAQPLSWTQPIEMGYRVGRRPQRRGSRHSDLSRHRRGATEHRRRYQDRAGRGLPAACARPSQPDVDRGHAGGADRVRPVSRSAWTASGPTARSSYPPIGSCCRAGAIGSAHLLMLSGIGPEDVLVGRGRSGAARHAPVRHSDQRSPGMGAAGGLDADAPTFRRWRRCSLTDGLEIRPYTAGFGAMMTGAGRSRRPSAHRRGADASAVAGQACTMVSDDPEVAPGIEHRYDSEPARRGHAERGYRAGARIGLVRNAQVRPCRLVDVAAPVRDRADGRRRREAAVVDDAVPGPRRRRAMGGRRLGASRRSPAAGPTPRS